MKTLIVLTGALVFMVYPAFGQGAQGAQITKRARDLVNENNVRQGIKQPSQPAAPVPVAKPNQNVAPSPAQIQQQNINKIKNDIAAILAGASQEKNQKLAADLTSAARGPKKPSSAVITRLANSIGTSLAGQTLGPAEQLRLAQDLEAVVNGSKMSDLQADAYVSDVQAILRVAGAKHAAAFGAAGDVKATISEIRH